MIIIIDVIAIIIITITVAIANVTTNINILLMVSFPWSSLNVRKATLQGGTLVTYTIRDGTVIDASEKLDR